MTTTLSPRAWFVVGIVFGWALIRLIMVRAIRQARSRGKSVSRSQFVGIVADWIILGGIVYLLVSGGYWQFAIGVIAVWGVVYLLGILAVAIMFFRRRPRR